MTLAPYPKVRVADFAHVKPLLLEMARERDHRRVLDLVVQRLAEVKNIGLARLWLTNEASDDSGHKVTRGRHLSVVASALGSIEDSAIGNSGSRETISCDDRNPEIQAWQQGDCVVDLTLAAGRWAWAERAGFGGLAAQPLECRGEFLGVVEVFTYTQVPPEGPSWLRLIADHAGAAVAGARSFAMVDRLRRRLQEQNDCLEEEIRELKSFGAIVGQSPALERMLEQIELVAPTTATVLIQGESGTGKELVARELHQRSQRTGKPLVRVNCASIPSELYESEFFGHVRGAFTGAVSDRAGRFEMADGGTLFLDEIGELPLEMQAKLLRVLQEGEYERVGEDRTRTVDVRILAATNRDMAAEVQAGRLREDLYYRLNVFPIRIPPLRERLEDVPVLAQHFAELAAQRLGRPKPRWSAAARTTLLTYEWPGNVRELQNVIERGLILATDGRLNFDLPMADRGRERAMLPELEQAGDKIVTDAALRAFEIENTRKALRLAGGRIAGPQGAAERLGLNPNTLGSRLRRLKLQGHAPKYAGLSSRS